MEQGIHAFNLWEGDLSGDGHNHVRQSILRIFTQPDVSRDELLDNFKTNLQALSFNMADLFAEWGSCPTENDLAMMKELRAKGWLQYSGLAGAPSETQAIALSAYYMPAVFSSLLLIRKDGSFVGGTGSFETLRAGGNWSSRPQGLSTDINDALGQYEAINYGGFKHYATAMRLSL